jgi:SHS2 domain-containing protein
MFQSGPKIAPTYTSWIWPSRRPKTRLTLVKEPQKKPEWLDYLDHTGDAGILVRALDLRQLFERAAWGMVSIVTDMAAIRLVQEAHIQVEANDLPALMLAWLSELNYQHVTERKLFGKFEVRKMSDRMIVAEVSGEAIAANRHTIFTEIKAVTFHGLRLEESDNGWEARIIFDL